MHAQYAAWLPLLKLNDSLVDKKLQIFHKYECTNTVPSAANRPFNVTLHSMKENATLDDKMNAE
jgi:hypothetical protein